MLSVQPSWSSLNIFDLVTPQIGQPLSVTTDDTAGRQAEPEGHGEYACFELVEVPALWTFKQYP